MVELVAVEVEFAAVEVELAAVVVGLAVVAVGLVAVAVDIADNAATAVYEVQSIALKFLVEHPGAIFRHNSYMPERVYSLGQESLESSYQTLEQQELARIAALAGYLLQAGSRIAVAAVAVAVRYTVYTFEPFRWDMTCNWGPSR